MLIRVVVVALTTLRPGPGGIVNTAVDGVDVVGPGFGFDAVGGCVP